MQIFLETFGLYFGSVNSAGSFIRVAVIKLTRLTISLLTFSMRKAENKIWHSICINIGSNIIKRYNYAKR